LVPRKFGGKKVDGKKVMEKKLGENEFFFLLFGLRKKYKNLDEKFEC